MPERAYDGFLRDDDEGAFHLGYKPDFCQCFDSLRPLRRSWRRRRTGLLSDRRNEEGRRSPFKSLYRLSGSRLTVPVRLRGGSDSAGFNRRAYILLLRNFKKEVNAQYKFCSGCEFLSVKFVLTGIFTRILTFIVEVRYAIMLKVC